MNCKHFGTCGGCSLPGVPYAEQLARKQVRLANLLKLDVPPLVPSPAEAGFRSKVAFVFGPAGQGRGLVMGHYARGSQRIVQIDECPVHSARGNRIAFALRDRLRRAGIPAVPSRGGILRHVIIRTTQDESEAVVLLVVTRNDTSLRTPVRGFLNSADRSEGFFLNIHDKPGPYMVGPETIKIDGRAQVKETGVGNRESGVESREPGAGNREPAFLVSPTAFFQTNVGAARELVRLVRDGVGAAPRVLDLYGGSGLFAVPLALAGAAVTVVEENRQAIKDLESNVRINRLPDGRVRAVCSRVEDALPRALREPWDAVILDPPRDGCSPGVLAGVFEQMAPPRVVYVSCNPDALALELPFILQAGYRVDRVQAVDMFPHTDHIETVLVLSRRA